MTEEKSIKEHKRVKLLLEKTKREGEKDYNKIY